MIEDENQTDGDFDVQDDLDASEGAAAPAPKASFQELWKNSPVLKVGAVVIAVAIGVAAYTTVTKPNPMEQVKSTVSGVEALDVEATPGKDALDKKYTEAVQKKNLLRAEEAAATGGSALPTPVATAKEQGLPIPQQSRNTAGDPLQEWKNSVAARKIKSDDVSADAEMAVPPPQAELVPMVQPVRPQGGGAAGGANAFKSDPAFQAAAQESSAQMRAILTEQTPKSAKTATVTSVKNAYTLAQEEQQKQQDAALSAAAGGGAAASGASSADGYGMQGASAGDPVVNTPKVIMTAGQVFYVQTLTEMNSDVPMPVMAAVLSGPFAGGRAMGAFTKQDEYLVVSFTRIIKDDVSYTITGMALDEKTTLPAVTGDVDHHYISRIVLPAAAKFISGYASAVSETGTETTTTSGGGVATSTPKPDAKESLYKGIDGAASTVSDVILGNLKKDITVKVKRGATMGVFLTDTVTTASVGK